MTKKIALSSFLLSVGMALTLPANAVILDWDLGGTATTTAGVINTLTFSTGGHNLTAKGYCSSGTNGTGSFSAAHVQVYGGGLGVNSGGDTAVCGGDTSSKNHAVDKNGHNNFVLFEFDSLMSASQFKIGYKNIDADIQVWFGPASGAAVDLNGACVVGCATTLEGLGFTATPGFNNIAKNVSQTVSASTKSRYVVVSGALNAVNGSIDSNFDYFKINHLSAQVPAPPTLALMALGLIMLHRRPKTQK